MSGIVIEGVTGAGKTETLRALTKDRRFGLLLAQGHVFGEEQTFGEVMAEISTDVLSAERHLRRMHKILETVDLARGFVFERFHLSYYALLPHWRLYEAIDRELAKLDTHLVLLVVPESLQRTRCLFRTDRSAEWTTGMINHFGSIDTATSAIRDSQRRRLEALNSTLLRSTVIDTTDQRWSDYSDSIINTWIANNSNPTGGSAG
jgi:hypothetical protein